MGVKRDEDFITEFIFVKLYNRSQSFRDIIKKKFKGKSISNKIKFTGSKNKNNPEFGCPDAIGTDGKLYIEIKTKMSTPLTPFEKASGAEHIKVKGEFKNSAKCTPSERKGKRSSASITTYGYKRFLDANEENKLLYVVCNENYDLSEACEEGSNVVYMYWTEILKYLKENNSDDELIKVIENCVEGLEDAKTHSTLDITTKLCKFSAILLNKRIISSTENICNEEYASILDSPTVWFQFDISETWLGISLETGDAYFYAYDEAYKILTNNNKINFGKKTIKDSFNENGALYKKIFSLTDSDESAFESLIDVLKVFLEKIEKGISE
jgi:hypothetical protein